MHVRRITEASEWRIGCGELRAATRKPMAIVKKELMVLVKVIKSGKVWK